MNILKISVSSIATLCLILLLTACGGGGGGDNNPAVEPGSIDNGGGSGGSSSDRTATLSWVPPTENTDGSPLTDLAGYKIYYGTTAGNYPNVITIDNPGIATYIIDNLPPGYTYYFVITSFDSFGQESEYSDVGSKTISA